MRELCVIFDQFPFFDDHNTAICRSTYFPIINIGKILNLSPYNACSTINHTLINCRLYYCNSIFTTFLRIKWTDWLKIPERITYKILMFTYKSYYNIAPTYSCELISRKESHANTRLGTDHHQLIMPPSSKDWSNTFLERSFIYAAPCKWKKMSEHVRMSNFEGFKKSVKTMLFTD